jgi:hypothetical protein
MNFPPLHDVVVKPFKHAPDGELMREVCIRCEFDDFPALAAAVQAYWKRKGFADYRFGQLYCACDAQTEKSWCWAEMMIPDDDVRMWMELKLKAKEWATPPLRAFDGDFDDPSKES